MNNDVILKMSGVRKTFPGVVALDDIHFELRKGEVHILLGENGAGKSTLVKILSGAYQKTSGRISIHGKETDIRSPKYAQQPKNLNHGAFPSSIYPIDWRNFLRLVTG